MAKLIGGEQDFQDSYGSWKTWKVLEFSGIFQGWKVLEIC